MVKACQEPTPALLFFPFPGIPGLLPLGLLDLWGTWSGAGGRLAGQENREDEGSKRAGRGEKAGGGAGSRFEPCNESGYERFRGHGPGGWGTQPHLL